MRDPHMEQPMATAGVALEDAAVALILMHGRGSDPSSMLALASHLDLSRTAVLAPTAAEGRWYPKAFLVPPEENEPDLSSALGVISALVTRCASAGIGPEKVLLGGFSQGACLVAEWVVRNPRRYGGLVVFSGGLIGPLGAVSDHEGTLSGTPVFVACSEIDPWIPIERFTETVREFERLEAAVEALIYTGVEHTIRPSEIETLNQMLHVLKVPR